MNEADKKRFEELRYRSKHPTARPHWGAAACSHVGWLVSQVEMLEAELARFKKIVFGDEVLNKVARFVAGDIGQNSDRGIDARYYISTFQQAIKEAVEKPLAPGLDLAHEGETSKSVSVIVEKKKPLPKPDYQKTQKYIDDLMQAHKDTANSKLKFGERP